MSSVVPFAQMAFHQESLFQRVHFGRRCHLIPKCTQIGVAASAFSQSSLENGTRQCRLSSQVGSIRRSRKRSVSLNMFNISVSCFSSCKICVTQKLAVGYVYFQCISFNDCCNILVPVIFMREPVTLKTLQKFLRKDPENKPNS